MSSTSKEKSNTDEYEDRDLKDYEVYNFIDSGDGKSWLLGTDEFKDNESNWANAYIGGYLKCPENITVPRSLTNKEGLTKPVEIIGQSAFLACGHNEYGKTKSVLITKQVRIIKQYGFGFMHDLESFRIELGSALDTIENRGLGWIGYNTGRNNPNKRGTLTLPSTISSVAQHGILQCNLFKVIIYCGFHPLTNSCELEWDVDDKINVKVTDQYNECIIFGQAPQRDSQSQAEVIEKCFGMYGNPFDQNHENFREKKVLSDILLLGILFSYSNSKQLN